MPATRGRLSRILWDNMGIKVVALLMAGVLWFYAVSEQEHTKTLNVPVQVVGTESGRLRVNGEVPKTVKVVVSGKGSDLIRLVGEDLKAVLNLNDQPEGDITVTLHPSDIVGPQGMVLHYSGVEGGSDIHLNLMRMAEKQVSVRVRHIGNPVSGMSYFIGFNVAANSRVTLIGPKTALADVDAVETEPLDLTGRSSDFNVTVKLVSPKPEIQLRDSDQVDLKVRIMPTVPTSPATISQEKNQNDKNASTPDK